MSDGFFLIEPMALNPLIGITRDHTLSVLALEWLLGRIREGDSLAANADLRVIRVEYHGAYPSIGLVPHGASREHCDAIESAIQRAAEELVASGTLAGLFEFAATNPRNWPAYAVALMS